MKDIDELTKPFVDDKKTKRFRKPLFIGIGIVLVLALLIGIAIFLLR